MDVILAILIVLAVVTVVGHAMWVLARATVRMAAGRPPFGDPKDQVLCGHCGRWMAKTCQSCDVCGKELFSSTAAELQDLVVFERQLKRFEVNQTLDPQAIGRLYEKLFERRQALQGQPPKKAAPEPEVPTVQRQPVALPKPTERQPGESEPILLAEEVCEREAFGVTQQPSPGAEPLRRPEPLFPPRVVPGVPVAGERPQPELVAPVPPKPPRQPLVETLAAFLEERNIQWVELVVVLISGLLIVGASVALVINFWETLQEIPWLKFAIFVVYSSAIFGMGLLCHHRWKLEAIGRGLLLIATLLVPLNFLAMASLSREYWDWTRLGLEVLSLGVFGWLVYLASRVLVPDGRWLQTVAVVGNSAAALLVARTSETGASGWMLSFVGLIPVAVFVAAIGIHLYRRSDSDLQPLAANAVFTLLGTAAFALAGALGLLVQKGIRADGLAATLDHASLLLVLTAFPVVAGGLTVMRRTTDNVAMAVYRTAGTAVALLGILLMLAAVVMAWPNPLAMLLVGSIATAALVEVAFCYELSLAHVGAIVAAAVVYLTGYHVLAGNLPLMDAAAAASKIVSVAMGPQTGAVLVGLVALLALAAGLLRRFGHEQHAPYYVGGCGIAASVSLFLVTEHGLLDTAAAMPVAMVVYAVYGIGSLALNAAVRKPLLSYLGSGLLAGAAFWGSHSLADNYPYVVQQPWLIALLTHATLIGALAILLRLWLTSGASEQVADEIHRVITKPLSETAAVSSVLGVPVLVFFSDWQETLWMAGCLWWLAAIWLVIAWTNRWPAMLAACQTAMTAAAVTTTTAWLEIHPFNAGKPVDLADPRCLQVYGVGLALLVLAWVAVRVVSRRNSAATQLLNPRWQSVDRVVAHGVVILQWLLVMAWLATGCALELIPYGKPGLEAFGPAAWILLGLLAVSLLAMLWCRWRETELVASLLLLATVPALVAGPFGGQLAAASATRWAMAVTLIVVSASVWQRERLLGWARSARANVEMGRWAPSAARTMLVVTLAVPVLVITLNAAWLKLDGTAPSGPLPGSVFGQMSTTVSYLIPLLLVVAAWVGFALRESSAGYAFAGGLVVQMAVVLGYLLHVAKFGFAEGATVIQLATITAGAWAIAWLVARRWVYVWHEEERGQSSSTALMQIQVGLAVLGNAVLLAPAWLAIVVEPSSGFAWTATVGMPLGWVAVGLLVAAVVYRLVQLGRPISPNVAGVVGMTTLGLLACTVQAMLPAAPEWGYRTLMLGLAAYSLFVVLATWWVASLRTLPGAQGPPQALVRAASGWVAAAGLAAVALGLKAAFFHPAYEELLWAAAAIAVSSLAGATMAFWRRTEGWALAAAPGVNLAASLVVWYVQWHSGRHLGPEQWLILMGQANVIASMAVALVWLAARKRLYELRDLTIRTSPLLAIQTSVGVVGNVALLTAPVGCLLLYPKSLPAWGASMADPAGWIALALAAAAATWYLWQTGPEKLGNVLAGAGLGLGVLTACVTGRFSGVTVLGAWSAYHMLEGTWASLGFLVLIAGILGRNLRLGGHARVESDVASEAGRLGQPYESLFPAGLIRSWVLAVGVAVLVVAVPYGSLDPAGPWWSIGAILCVSLMAGVLGMWQRQAVDVLASGLLLNVAATAYWWATGEAAPAGLAVVNIFALAVATVLWSFAERVHRRGVPAVVLGAERVPPSHLAAQGGVVLLAIYACAMVICDAASIGNARIDRSGWCALAATAIAVLVLMWDRRARFPLAALYVVGLAGAVMLLVWQPLTVEELVWTAPLVLSVFALAAAVAARCLPRMQAAWQSIGISSREGSWPTDWFPTTQAYLAGVAAAIGVWVSLDVDFQHTANPAVPGLAGRIAGCLALGLLVPAGVLSAARARGQRRSGWQAGVLVLGLLLLSTAGWAWLDPQIAAPWLHRTVVLLVAGAVMSLVAGVALPRVLASASDWQAAVRRTVPGLAGCALLALVAVLVQEVVLYVPGSGTPMSRPAVVVVAAALAGLIAGAITLAVVGRLDPLRLSDRGRTLYVYAAEVLLALVGVHLRLTMPWLFQLGIVERYWMLIVLALAYAGAALGELFHRRGLPVLSEPLLRTATLLPLGPAVGFWFFARPDTLHGLAGASPALWFLAGAFYAVLGKMRRSGSYLTAASVVTCVGLCVLWHQADLRFWDHPQLWLIPFALVFLVAEHLNHDRLTERQSTALRYIGLSVIYISSTSEYLRVLGQSIVLPMVLILLSLAGVAAGLVLRIRSFLFMGVTFLALVVVTMIKYAAVDQHQTWVLSIFCILLGSSLIAAFALFQKRREAILSAVRRFRTWQR